MNIPEKPIVDSIPDKMSRKINSLAAERIISYGNKFTVDELIAFFWKGFLALKNVKEKEGDLCQKKHLEQK